MLFPPPLRFFHPPSLLPSLLLPLLLSASLPVPSFRLFTVSPVKSKIITEVICNPQQFLMT